MALKDLLFSGESTKLANLPILRRVKTKEKTLITKDQRRCKKLTKLGAQLFGQLFLGLRDFFKGENEPQPPFIYVEKGQQFSHSFTKEKQLD